MGQQLSEETQRLLERADRAIFRSREVVNERRRLIAHCRKEKWEQEIRLSFRRQSMKPGK